MKVNGPAAVMNLFSQKEQAMAVFKKKNDSDFRV